MVSKVYFASLLAVGDMYFDAVGVLRFASAERRDVCRDKAMERSAWAALEVPRRVILGWDEGCGWEGETTDESSVDPSMSGRRILDETSNFWREDGMSRLWLMCEDRSDSVEL